MSLSRKERREAFRKQKKINKAISYAKAKNTDKVCIAKQDMEKIRLLDNNNKIITENLHGKIFSNRSTETVRLKKKKKMKKNLKGKESNQKKNYYTEESSLTFQNSTSSSARLAKLQEYVNAEAKQMKQSVASKVQLDRNGKDAKNRNINGGLIRDKEKLKDLKLEQREDEKEINSLSRKLRLNAHQKKSLNPAFADDFGGILKDIEEGTMSNTSMYQEKYHDGDSSQDEDDLDKDMLSAIGKDIIADKNIQQKTDNQKLSHNGSVNFKPYKNKYSESCSDEESKEEYKKNTFLDNEGEESNNTDEEDLGKVCKTDDLKLSSDGNVSFKPHESKSSESASEAELSEESEEEYNKNSFLDNEGEESNNTDEEDLGKVCKTDDLKLSSDGNVSFKPHESKSSESASEAELSEESEEEYNKNSFLDNEGEESNNTDEEDLGKVCKTDDLKLSSDGNVSFKPHESKSSESASEAELSEESEEEYNKNSFLDNEGEESNNTDEEDLGKVCKTDDLKLSSDGNVSFKPHESKSSESASEAELSEESEEEYNKNSFLDNEGEESNNTDEEDLGKVCKTDDLKLSSDGNVSFKPHESKSSESASEAELSEESEEEYNKNSFLDNEGEESNNTDEEDLGKVCKTDDLKLSSDGNVSFKPHESKSSESASEAELSEESEEEYNKNSFLDDEAEESNNTDDEETSVQSDNEQLSFEGGSCLLGKMEESKMPSINSYFDLYPSNSEDDGDNDSDLDDFVIDNDDDIDYDSNESDLDRIDSKIDEEYNKSKKCKAQSDDLSLEEDITNNNSSLDLLKGKPKRRRIISTSSDDSAVETWENKKDNNNMSKRKRIVSESSDVSSSENLVPVSESITEIMDVSKNKIKLSNGNITNTSSSSIGIKKLENKNDNNKKSERKRLLSESSDNCENVIPANKKRRRTRKKKKYGNDGDNNIINGKMMTEGVNGITDLVICDTTTNISKFKNNFCNGDDTDTNKNINILESSNSNGESECSRTVNIITTELPDKNKDPCSVNASKGRKKKRRDTECNIIERNVVHDYEDGITDSQKCIAMTDADGETTNTASSSFNSASLKKVRFSLCSSDDICIPNESCENPEEKKKKKKKKKSAASSVDGNKSAKEYSEPAVVTHEGTYEDIYGRIRDKDGNIIVTDCNGQDAKGTYIPPALRKLMELNKSETKKEKLAALQKRIKGLLNRLAESNLSGIVGQIESLYQCNSRNDMNETLTKLLVETVVAPVLTPERLVQEHALVIAVLSANIGPEVGGHILAEFTIKFMEDWEQSWSHLEQSSKELENLLLFISQLYNFRVTDASLIYAILQELLQRFDIKEIELILLVLRSVGFTLRKDDPLALKRLILKIQSKADEAKRKQTDCTYSKVKFMLEILVAIRNNNMSKVPNYDPTHSEHLKTLMKGLLRKGCRVSDLKISLEDILKSKTQGKWWVVGSAWSRGLKEEEQQQHQESIGEMSTSICSATLQENDYSEMFKKKAKKFHLSRPPRVNILYALTDGAEDYIDSCQKLIQLNLPASQESEIFNVMLICNQKYKFFNQFYVKVALKLLNIKKGFHKALQVSLWDKFSDLNRLKQRNISNLAKFVAHLVAENGLTLSVFRNLDFSSADETMVSFLRQCFIALLLHPQGNYVVERAFKKLVDQPKLKLLRQCIRVFIIKFINPKKVSENKDKALLAGKVNIALNILTSTGGVKL